MIIKIVSILCLVCYLLYLSVVDIKKRELQYWQTGLLFPITLFYLFSNDFHFFPSLKIHNDSIRKTILFAFLGFILGLILMLSFSLIKVNGQNAFGGADIWVTAALGLAFGINDTLWLIIFSCIYFLIYCVIYKLIKKEKPVHTAFVPFLSLGALNLIILYLIF